MWWSIRYGDWDDAILPFGCACGCLLADYFALRQIIPGFISDRWIGVLKAIIDIGPKAIGLVNEFLAELMADIIFIGFVPGGKVGFIIGTAFSLGINLYLFWLAADWLKEVVNSRR